MHLPYQRFFTSLSLRPGSMRAIFAHLLPNSARTLTINFSSSSDQLVFFNSGLRWLCHLSRHCFPTRPGKKRPMNDHFVRPCCLTNDCSASSSSGVQEPLPLTIFGFNTMRQWAMHCSCVFNPPTCWTILIQFLDLCTLTATWRASLSSLVQEQGAAKAAEGALWVCIFFFLVDAAVEVTGEGWLFLRLSSVVAAATEGSCCLLVEREVMTERRGSKPAIEVDMVGGGGRVFVSG